MEASQFFGVEVDSSGHRGNLVRLPLEAMPIEHISSRRFVGEVRNLSVDGDESYVAAGVVAHNCVCRTAPMRKSWRKGLEKLGYLDEAAESSAK